MMFAKVRKRDGKRGAKPLKSVDFSSHNVKTPALLHKKHRCLYFCIAYFNKAKASLILRKASFKFSSEAA